MTNIDLFNECKPLMITDKDLYVNILKKNSMNNVENNWINYIITFGIVEHIINLSNDYIKLFRIVNIIFRSICKFLHTHQKRSGSLRGSEAKILENFFVQSGNPVKGKSIFPSLNYSSYDNKLISVSGPLSDSDF